MVLQESESIIIPTTMARSFMTSMVTISRRFATVQSNRPNNGFQATSALTRRRA